MTTTILYVWLCVVLLGLQQLDSTKAFKVTLPIKYLANRVQRRDDEGVWSQIDRVRALNAYPRGGQSPRKGASKKKRTTWSLGNVELSVTNVLIGLNLLIFGATQLWPSLQMRFMKNNRMISYGQTYRIFTSTLLHGSLQHLLMNTYSLYQVGPLVEQSFGSARMGCLYIGAGSLANLATYLVGKSPFSVGASGCLFGLIGALGFFFYRNRKILGPRAEAGFDSIKRTVFMNLMYGFMLPGVDNGAHIGGLCGGAILSFLVGPRLQVLPGSNGGRLRVVDRPLLNYIPYWRNFLEGIGPNQVGGGKDQGSSSDRFKPRGAPLLD